MITNREHYSWSQHSLFKSSKLSYYKRYVLGTESPPNIRFEKGKEFGKFKETGERPHWVTDPLLEEVAGLIPDLDYTEEELYIDFFAGREDKPEWFKPIKMFTDASNKERTVFHEYKTGKEPWTQQKVDDHQQLDFYAAGYYYLSGQETIPRCTLYWIETEDYPMPDGSTEVRYTGHVEEFERTFTETDILAITKDILATQKAINDWEYGELELDEDQAARYCELLKQKDSIDAELNLIKLSVESQLLELDFNYAVSKEHGKFSFSERKSWNYSKKLTDLKKKYNKWIKKIETKEQKDGTAKVNINKSIRFTRPKE